MMFESDDFDQVLSQVDFPELNSKKQTEKEVEDSKDKQESNFNIDIVQNVQSNSLQNEQSSITKPVDSSRMLSDNWLSPKHTKRKIINSHFDQNTKRKFPGPAGLLSGSFQETDDENICHMELLSQDIDFSQNHIHRDLFDSTLWKKLVHDVNSWDLGEIDTIKAIKQQALNGNLQQRKARTVIAFIVTVDRSVTDPLVTLRDASGNIKCTLHRDAWSNFSSYIVSEYCALVLWKPTVLTTGSAFKKHYLNITLSNIFAIYSSAVLNESDDKEMPNGYVRLCEENLTIIKTEKDPKIGYYPTSKQLGLNNQFDINSNDLLDGLDVSVFSEDIF